MIKINLDELRIDFPQKPSKIWDHDSKKVFYDYRVWAFSGEDKVGHITVSVCQAYPIGERCTFWFDRRCKYSARPVVVFQDTEEDYKGQGINGRVIVLANELAKERFHQPLVSDNHFIRNPRHLHEDFNYALYPSMRVWEKLEAAGLAKSACYKHKPRWAML